MGGVVQKENGVAKIFGVATLYSSPSPVNAMDDKWA